MAMPPAQRASREHICKTNLSDEKNRHYHNDALDVGERDLYTQRMLEAADEIEINLKQSRC